MAKLILTKIGIDTYKENIAYMPQGCEICKSQGFGALSKIEIHHGGNSILATLNITENGLVSAGQVGLSHGAFNRLGALEGAEVEITHPNPLFSIEYIREKLNGRSLHKEHFLHIAKDILNYRYSNIELTAFSIACSNQLLSEKEIRSLTEVMIETGEQIHWGFSKVLDKHCVGGIPGNRTTMVVVPIIAALGHPIPKTSSRAITSPSGTADTMETLTNVYLSLEEMQRLVAEEKACIAWGGALALAPMDDIMISVERALNLESKGQMVASILSKKKSAGSTHLLLDIPVGPTAKIQTKRDAEHLKALFEKTGRAIGIKVRVVFTSGLEPVGQGIGPVLEAQDVLKVLRNEADAPKDLKNKSLFLAGQLLEHAQLSRAGQGQPLAKATLESGAAWEKFSRILQRQGPTKHMEPGPFSETVASPRGGTIQSIHNQKIAKVAKLAGAPQDAKAGVYLHAKTGQEVKKGRPLLTLYAETGEELEFALKYLRDNPDTIQLD